MATAKKELVSIVSLYLHLRSGHLNVIGGVPVTGRAEISSPFRQSGDWPVWRPGQPGWGSLRR
jgi:hypothetical protein